MVAPLLHGCIGAAGGRRYDGEGRARSEDERRTVCEYCGGTGACDRGAELLPVKESPPADPADLARRGLPAWA